MLYSSTIWKTPTQFFMITVQLHITAKKGDKSKMELPELLHPYLSKF